MADWRRKQARYDVSLTFDGSTTEQVGFGATPFSMRMLRMERMIVVLLTPEPLL